MQQDNSVHILSTHTQQTQLRTKSMTPLCCSCCSRSFSMNGTRYPTAFFITRADLITWGRNIRPEPNRSPTTDIPCNKAIIDSRLHAGFYTARCSLPTSGSTPQVVSANNLKQCGAAWQIRWKFDYLFQHGTHTHIAKTTCYRTQYGKTRHHAQKRRHITYTTAIGADWATAPVNTYRKFREVWTCGFLGDRL